MVLILEHVAKRTLRPPAPNQTVRMRVHDVQDERASLKIGNTSVAILVCAIAVFAVCAVRLDAARDAGVIVNQQIGIRRRQLQLSGRQLLLDGAFEMVLEERVLIQTRVASGQRIGRAPGEGFVVRHVEPTLDMWTHRHRGAGCSGPDEQGSSDGSRIRRVIIPLSSCEPQWPR